jgi:hypothetical protein
MKLPLKSKDQPKTSSKDRRKKLSRFKDTARSCFGPPKSSGYGLGKTLFCLKCNNQPVHGAQLKSGLWYCKDCGSNDVVLKSKDSSD